MNEPSNELIINNWTDQVEEYITNIKNLCQTEAERHDKAGYSAKNLYNIFALPAILVPLIAAPIQGTFKDDDWTIYFSMSALVVTSILTGINSFFNYGAKMQKHFNFSGRYGDIVTDIEESLTKPRSNRVSSEVFIRTQKMKFDSLNLTAPK